MIRTLRRTSILAAVVSFVLLALSSGRADAQPQILRPSTRPMWFAGGIGPEFFGLNEPGRGYRRPGVGRFKLAVDFGYHFSGDGEGPAIGATIEQSFGGYSTYMFNPGFKFWWDIEIADMAIYVTPFAKAGYAFATRPRTCFYEPRFGGCRRGAFGHFFNLAVGVEGRVVLHDRGLLFLRPVQVDTYLGPDDYWGSVFVVGYTVLLGGGVTF